MTRRERAHRAADLAPVRGSVLKVPAGEHRLRFEGAGPSSPQSNLKAVEMSTAEYEAERDVAARERK